jgi:CRISPR-associated protein Csx10
VKHFSLTLETMSPLAIRADHAPTGADSAGYISGSALIGSLANVYRLYHQESREEFEQLFLSGQVQYPDLYPASFKGKEARQPGSSPVYALPMTAQSCKRFTGFFHDQEDDPPHGVRDALLDWATFELGRLANVEMAALLESLKPQKQCLRCGKPMERFTGYYRNSNEDGRPVERARVDTRLQTHTGIDRDTGTVQEGILYNRRVFNEHTQFWGMVKLPEHLTAPLQQFIDDVGQSGLVRVGTGRTRGLGKAHLSMEPMRDGQYSLDAFKKNLERFNTALREHAEGAYSENFATQLQPFYFALTLHAPVILRDELLRYRGTIDEKTLARLPGMPDDSANPFSLIYQAASTKRVTGWNELWGTPRMNEYAIDTGSVFLFASSVELNNDLLHALFDLEENGIGQRRGEGFGRVRVSDPFHLEVQLR